MKSFLENELKTTFDIGNYTSWFYEESINDPKSFIYKVAVCCAIDSNKADWCIIALGTQRAVGFSPEIHGTMRFKRGENDDPGNILRRMTELLEKAGPLFEGIISNRD